MILKTVRMIDSLIDYATNEEGVEFSGYIEDGDVTIRVTVERIVDEDYAKKEKEEDVH